MGHLPIYPPIPTLYTQLNLLAAPCHKHVINQPSAVSPLLFPQSPTKHHIFHLVVRGQREGDYVIYKIFIQPNVCLICYIYILLYMCLLVYVMTAALVETVLYFFKIEWLRLDFYQHTLLSDS